MKSRRPNRIAELRKLRGLTQAQLAEKVDAHWVTISRLERGQLQLNEEWLRLLSEALDCDQNQILNWDVPKPTVYLAGNIYQGTRVNFFECQNEFDLPLDPADDIVTSWFKVTDDAGWPFLRTGDLLRFFAVHEWEAIQFVSRLCMIFSPAEGDGHIGFLEKGASESVFTIRPIVGRPIEGLKAERLRICAEIRFAMPWAAAIGLAASAK